MSLLDENAKTGEMDGLARPLILPPTNIQLVMDIVTIEKVPKKRWRSYIAASDWTAADWKPPYKGSNPQPDKLEAKRQYHARMVYETSCYLSMTNPDWLSVSTIKLIQVTAHFELRKCEVILISYQLAAQQVGLKTTHVPSMYRTACELFVTMNWLAEKIFSAGEKTKERRALWLNCKQLRPWSTDNAKTMGENIDKLLYAMMCFLKDENFKPMLSLMDSGFVEEVGNKLKKCILLLDELLIKVE